MKVSLYQSYTKTIEEEENTLAKLALSKSVSLLTCCG